MHSSRSKTLNKNKQHKSTKTTNEKIYNNSMQEINSDTEKTQNEINLTQKRLREVVQDSLLLNASKVSRSSITESPFKLVTMLDKRFDNLSEQLNIMIENKFKEHKEELLCEIDKRFASLQSDLLALNERVTLLETTTIKTIKKSIDKLESGVSEIKNIENEIKELKKKLNKQDNSTVAGSIRIRGVPYYDSENLYDIFSKICNSLNISTPQVDSIYRHNKIYKDNTIYSPKDEVIVVKMHSPYDRNFLLKTIAKYRRENKSTLCLKHAGFDSVAPIFVNENLTPHNHKIFQQALKMKRDKQLNNVYTLRGLVYVKRNVSDEPVHVEFLDELQCLFRN